MFAQPTLFAGQDVVPDPSFAGIVRHDLDGHSWIDRAPGWLGGDDVLFDAIRDVVVWRQPVVRMYDRDVLTPRLVGTVDPAAHPAIGLMVALLSTRYDVELSQVSAGFYRDGDDSVAWHGDRIARERPSAVVATVSLGGPRTFRIRPNSGGPSSSWSLGHGDLVVMGGSCQRDWQHTVPKTAHAPARIAVMFRHSHD